MQGEAGEGCTTLPYPGWGGYRPAQCTMWKASVGLKSRAALPKGPRIVVCQADLGTANPVFTKGQRNTWWVWVVTDDGSMDWFPHTAVSQGESDRPINGIALCE